MSSTVLGIADDRALGSSLRVVVTKPTGLMAAKAAVDRAGKSLRDLRVAEVVKLDMQLDAKGKIEAYRAKLNVSFKYED